jgi:hypothetical protein
MTLICIICTLRLDMSTNILTPENLKTLQARKTDTFIFLIYELLCLS